MFKKRTLFVVGAGASAEFGFPTGPQLAARISEKLDVRYDEWGERLTHGDKDLWGQVHYTHRQEIREYQEAAWLIRDGVRLSSSIDDFLDVHSADQRLVRIGKSAIVQSILEAERASTLFYDRSRQYSKLPFAAVEKTWLIKLVRMLGRGILRGQEDSFFNNLGFVIFNYDRCVEHFLQNALKQFYNLRDDQAAEIMKTLWIFHPYGVVAPLPWMGRGGVEFGGPEHQSASYLGLAEKIKTYTEQIDDASQVDAIRSQVLQADKIIFLGFAFHDQNIQLLKPADDIKTRKQIFGTGFGMSKSDVEVVRDQLMALFESNTRMTMGDKIVIENSLKCSDLFEHYSKSLPA